MRIENGDRVSLTIEGVFEGTAGVSGGIVAFVPNRSGRSPGVARAGIMSGEVVSLAPVKDDDGPFWSSRFKVIES